jgi:uncharacterized membrane protein
MNEAMYVNFFTVLRAVLIGGILLIIPHITRKGLLFGTYVGEELAAGGEARSLKRRWYRGCVLLILLAAASGLLISYLGSPIAGNLTCAAILVLVGPILYFRLHFASRKLVPPAAVRQGASAAAPLAVEDPRGATFAKITMAICILIGLAAVVYAWMSYGSIHLQLPILSDQTGEESGEHFTRVMLAPVMDLLIPPFFALLALLTANAKHSIRGGSGGRSVEAQSAFRTAMTKGLSGTALFLCALLSFISFEYSRAGLTLSRILLIGVLVISVAMLVFMLGYFIRIFLKYGQGGSRIEEGSTEAPLTNGLADNTYWVGGIFYVNKDDPSIAVEKRFGFGYTFNYGNWKAILLVVVYPVLAFGFVLFLLFKSLGWNS